MLARDLSKADLLNIFFAYIYFTINTNDLLSDYENKYLFMLGRVEFSCVRIGHLIPNMMFS